MGQESTKLGAVPCGLLRITVPSTLTTVDQQHGHRSGGPITRVQDLTNLGADTGSTETRVPDSTDVDSETGGVQVLGHQMLRKSPVDACGHPKNS